MYPFGLVMVKQSRFASANSALVETVKMPNGDQAGRSAEMAPMGRIHGFHNAKGRPERPAKYREKYRGFESLLKTLRYQRFSGGGVGARFEPSPRSSAKS
jgi:hypothetical protein